MEPKEFDVAVQDYIVIEGHKFQIKRQSVEPWFTLQEVSN